MSKDKELFGNTEELRRAERAVIGAMLHDNTVIPDVVRILPTEESFYFDHCRRLYRHITRLHQEGKPIDLVLLADALSKSAELKDCGGYSGLGEIYTESPSAANVEHYAKIVLDYAMGRGALIVSQEMQDDIKNRVGPANQIIASYQHKLEAISQQAAFNEPVTLHEALNAQLTEIDRRVSGGALSGIPTGFLDLDKILVGLQPGELTIIAARPSVGKTLFGLNIASNVARQERSVLFVSLEQTRAQICERLLAAEAKVNSFKIRTGKLNSQEMDDLVDAGARMRQWQFRIDDTSAQVISAIEAHAKNLKRRIGLDAVFIDYLQLIHPDDRRIARYEQLGQISGRLKAIAKTLKIPVVAMAQVNRESGSGDQDSPPPKLHQLRESGSLEQDADVVVLLHRDNQGDPTRNIPQSIRVDVAKNRDGKTGVVMMACFPQFLRFENLAPNGITY